VIYESRHEPLLRRAAFLRRLARHVAGAGAIFAASVVIGMAGYAGFEGLSAIDAFLNACMLLGGMGPVHVPATPAGKLFAGVFALYAGLVFCAAAALVAAPVLHRVLHRFHLERR
jgi:hypothetical protein